MLLNREKPEGARRIPTRLHARVNPGIGHGRVVRSISCMNILFLGDIFASAGRRIVAEQLPHIVASEAIGLIIANAENAAGGFGITPLIAEELLSLGVDVLTTGNHIWDKREINDYLPQQPRLLRPANYADGLPGTGLAIVEPAGGVRCAVINLQGRTHLPPTDCPFRKADAILEGLDPSIKVRIVDFHAEATSEKVAMGWHLDGRVSADDRHPHAHPDGGREGSAARDGVPDRRGDDRVLRLRDWRPEGHHLAALPDLRAGSDGGRQTGRGTALGDHRRGRGDGPGPVHPPLHGGGSVLNFHEKQTARGQCGAGAQVRARGEVRPDLLRAECSPSPLRAGSPPGCEPCVSGNRSRSPGRRGGRSRTKARDEKMVRTLEPPRLSFSSEAANAEKSCSPSKQRSEFDDARRIERVRVVMDVETLERRADFAAEDAVLVGLGVRLEAGVEIGSRLLGREDANCRRQEAVQRSA